MFIETRILIQQGRENVVELQKMTLL